MNLVFGSVLLFILISPGLIFRFSYLQGSYAKLTFKVSAVEEVFWALVPAMIFQVLGIWTVEKFFGVNIRIDTIYLLVVGDHADFPLIKSSLIPFFFYTTVLLAISVFAGMLTRVMVRILRLDLYWKFLRFGNEWYYLLSGEILNLPKSHEKYQPGAFIQYWKTIFRKKVKPLLIQVDALVNSSEGDMIYSGILKDFFLSKDNGLDRLYLSNVYRRTLKNDLENEDNNPGFLSRDTDERYYAMPGDFFVISYSNVQNLNITYYLEQEEETADEPESK